MTPRQHAKALVEGYARQSKEQPDVAEWARGLKLAERWLSLMDASAPDHTQISELLQEVESLKREGNASMTLDLSLGVNGWARKTLKR